MRRISKRTFLSIIIVVTLLIAGGTYWYYSLQPNDVATNPSETSKPPSQKVPEPNDDKQDDQITPPQADENTDPPIVPSTPTPPVDNTPTPPINTPTPAELSRVATSAKLVYFTFDAGSGNQSLTQIMAALDKRSLKATFFVTGKWADTNRSELQIIASRGHSIYNHTYSHPDLTTVSVGRIVEELNSTDTSIRSITGKSSKPYFRPPFGARNQQVLDAAWSQGFQSVYWSVDTLDWQTTATTASVKQRVLDGLAPGTIYLLHVGSNVTGQVIDGIFAEVIQKGYTIRAL